MHVTEIQLITSDFQKSEKGQEKKTLTEDNKKEGTEDQGSGT
jgi:hypothetical protein